MSSNLPVVREELEIEDENIIYRDVTIGLVLGIMIGTFIGHFVIPRSKKVTQEDKANTQATLKLEENTSPEPNPLVVAEPSKVPASTDSESRPVDEDKNVSQVLPNVSSEDNRVVDVSKYN